MRNLHTDGYTTNTEAVKRLDDDVLRELKTLRAQGRTSVRAGELARRFSVDSVQALGSLERLRPRLRKEGMI